jgi:putative ABC transport system permease protein
MNATIQDLKHGIRRLSRSPMFTVLAATMLALGIGANTTVFSLVNALLLRPLPYPDANRLVTVSEERTGAESRLLYESSYATYAKLRERTRSFAGIAAYSEEGFNLGGSEQPERTPGAIATSELFSVLQVRPLIGRTFTSGEDAPGAGGVVVLSYDLWQSRFAGDSSVLGRHVTLDGIVHTVIGVMPSGFRFQELARLWVPVADRVERNDPTDRRLEIIGRLATGTSAQQARAELARVWPEVAAPPRRSGVTVSVRVRPFGAERDDGLGPPMMMLLGVVGFVLLIACANVANLTLARAAARQREFGIRAMLGASRSRLVRELLAESALVAALGTVAGLFIALWVTDALVAALFPVEFMPAWLHFGIDWRVLLFTALAGAITTVVFGLTPALTATKTDLANAVKDATNPTRHSSGLRLRRGLITAQIALSLVLATGALLLVRSVMLLQRTDWGYDPRSVLSMRVTAPPATYRDSSQIATLSRAITTRLAGVPQTRGAAVYGGATYPGGGELARDLTIEAAQQPSSETLALVRMQAVTPQFFDVLGVPLLMGRRFTWNNADKVVIVNDEFAHRFWPAENPLGRRVRIDSNDPASPWYTVIGVSGSIRSDRIDSRGVGTTARPEIYIPFEARPARLLNILVRVNGDPLAFATAMRSAVREVDANLPVYQVMSFERERGVFIRFLRTLGFLLGGFAALALGMSLLGIWGVMAYTVSQRTREIGIRIALGARSADVRALIVKQGARPILAGIALGLLLTVGLTRVLRMVLYQVHPLDPAVLVSVIAAVAALALLGTYGPARSATRISPQEALRSE